MPFDFNVDVRLTDRNDSDNVQSSNMIVASVPAGADRTLCDW